MALEIKESFACNVSREAIILLLFRVTVAMHGLHVDRLFISNIAPGPLLLLLLPGRPYRLEDNGVSFNFLFSYGYVDIHMLKRFD